MDPTIIAIALIVAVVGVSVVASIVKARLFKGIDKAVDNHGRKNH